MTTTISEPRRVRARTLGRSFYAVDARVVARRLLNKVIVRDDAPGGAVSARIVEVEAYLGDRDPGSHAYRGLTPRTAVMFGPPGHLYVYFTYGMHWCANVVTGHDGAASAVLLRAAAPLTGLDVMHAHRSRARRAVDLCSGPARLTQAFALTGAHNGTDLTRGPLRLIDDGVAPPARPGVSTRVGLRDGRGNHQRWRWYVRGDANVSRGPRATAE